MTSFVRWLKAAWSRNEPERDPVSSTPSTRGYIPASPVVDHAFYPKTELPVHTSSDRIHNRANIQGFITLTIKEEDLSRRQQQNPSVQNTFVSGDVAFTFRTGPYGCTGRGGLGAVVYTSHVNLVPVRQEDHVQAVAQPSSITFESTTGNSNANHTWNPALGISFRDSTQSPAPTSIILEPQPKAHPVRELEASQTSVSNNTESPKNHHQRPSHGSHPTQSDSPTGERPKDFLLTQAGSSSPVTPGPALFTFNFNPNPKSVGSKFDPSNYSITKETFQFNENFTSPTPPPTSVFGGRVEVKRERSEMAQVKAEPPAAPRIPPKQPFTPPEVNPVTPAKQSSSSRTPITPPESTSPQHKAKTIRVRLPKPTTPTPSKPQQELQVQATGWETSPPPSPTSTPPPANTTSTPGTQTHPLPRHAPIRIDRAMQWTSLREMYSAQLTPSGHRVLPFTGPPCQASGCTENLEYAGLVGSGSNAGRPQYLCCDHRWDFGTFGDLQTEEEDDKRRCSCGERSRRTEKRAGGYFWKCMEMRCRWKQFQ